MMDIEMKVQILRACSSKKGNRCSSCPAFGHGDRNCIRNAMKDAATALHTLQSENEKLRADMECIITGLDLQRQYTNHYQQLTDMGLEASNSLLVKLEKVKEELKQVRKESVNRLRINSELMGKNSDLKNELEQVKHQLDSYRMYHDDLASKPNCNTCADKDCKYRPIPGDTVRANCPLWRGPKED